MITVVQTVITSHLQMQSVFVTRHNYSYINVNLQKYIREMYDIFESLYSLELNLFIFL